MQNHLRERMHRVVNQLPDENLGELWSLMSAFYWDVTMLEAIGEAKRSLTPGDNFTRDEAMRLLSCPQNPNGSLQSS